MAEQILVTPEQLESAAQRISGLADEYKGKYDSLYEKSRKWRPLGRGLTAASLRSRRRDSGMISKRCSP